MLTLQQLIATLGGELIVADGQDRQTIGALALSGTAPLATAGALQISFLAHTKYRRMAAASVAGCIIVSPAEQDCTARPRIVTRNPYAYFARVAQCFAPLPAAQPGIHPSAIVDPTAAIDPTAQVGPLVVVEAGATVAAGAIVGAHCFIGAGVLIGPQTRLAARVTVYAGCEVGARVIVHSGAVIGADGFGFAQDQGAWVKIPQTGRVLIGNDCEIGANTCIDRGAMGDTVLGNDVKLDNLVQIGHNVSVGDHTAMAGCVGVAGSAVIGASCQIGGAAVVLGHLQLADGVIVQAMSLVTKSLTKPGVYSASIPVMEQEVWLKNAAQLRRLDALSDKIRHLQLSPAAQPTESDSQ